MRRSSNHKLLRSLSGQAIGRINCLASNDEPRGDIGDRANALAEAYRLLAISRVLGKQTEVKKIEKTTGEPHKCERCGKPIPKARLKVLPRTTLCVECRKLLEQERHNHRRFVCIS
jgi:phage/conjugal plasmid C-4 type zinc finger TraR family protein